MTDLQATGRRKIRFRLIDFTKTSFSVPHKKYWVAETVKVFEGRPDALEMLDAFRYQGSEMLEGLVDYSVSETVKVFGGRGSFRMLEGLAAVTRAKTGLTPIG